MSDVENILRIPLDLHEQQMRQRIFDTLHLEPRTTKNVLTIDEWRQVAEKAEASLNSTESVRIALVGDQRATEFSNDSVGFRSTRAALVHAAVHCGHNIEICGLDAAKLATAVAGGASVGIGDRDGGDDDDAWRLLRGCR